MKPLTINRPKDEELILGEANQPSPRMKDLTNAVGNKISKEAFIRGYILEKILNSTCEK